MLVDPVKEECLIRLEIGFFDKLHPQALDVFDSERHDHLITNIDFLSLTYHKFDELKSRRNRLSMRVSAAENLFINLVWDRAR